VIVSAGCASDAVMPPQVAAPWTSFVLEMDGSSGSVFGIGFNGTRGTELQRDSRVGAGQAQGRKAQAR